MVFQHPVRFETPINPASFVELTAPTFPAFTTSANVLNTIVSESIKSEQSPPFIGPEFVGFSALHPTSVSYPICPPASIISTSLLPNSSGIDLV